VIGYTDWARDHLERAAKQLGGLSMGRLSMKYALFTSPQETDMIGSPNHKCQFGTFESDR
jgi:hypothetical protein